MRANPDLVRSPSSAPSRAVDRRVEPRSHRGRRAAIGVAVVLLVVIGVLGRAPVRTLDDVAERVALLTDVEPIGASPESCEVVRGPVCVVASASGDGVTAPTARPADRVAVPYGADPHHLVDLWIPEGEGPHPVLVWLHGGGWIAGGRGTPPDIVDHLATAGWMVVSADYRLATLESGSFPDAIHDVQRVLDWVVTHADDLRADPESVVLAGGSAGGHLALLAAFTVGTELAAPDVEPREVAAVVSLVGITDLPAFALGEHPWAHALPRALLACGDGPCDDEVLRRASPTSWVTPDAPPVYVAKGGQDVLVLPDQAWLLAERFEMVGGRTPKVWLDIIDHADHNLTVDDVSLDALDEFLHEATGYPTAGGGRV